MQLTAAVIVLLSLLWLAVLASLFGLIGVALSRYEGRASRLLGLAIGTLTVAVAFGLALSLAMRLTTAAYTPPIYALQKHPIPTTTTSKQR